MRSRPAAQNAGSRLRTASLNLHRLDLVSLSLFCVIARTGSISKGATLANLALGAASRRMVDLESAVGASLFERHSRGVTLTPAGKALQAHAQRILADVDHLAADLSDFAHGVIGAVRLWANTSAITQFLPHDLARFVRESPGIRIELEEQNSDDIVRAVLEGRADIGIFADRTQPLGLQTVNYRRDQLVLVLPQDHPLADKEEIGFEQATDYEFVSLTAGTSLAMRMQYAAEELGRRLRLRIRVRSFDAMCQMVAAGLGIAVLPQAAVQPLVAAMDLRQIRLSDEWAYRRLLIGARNFSAMPRPVRLLMDCLLDEPPSPAHR